MSCLVPQRRQGYADRLFGEAYRRVELRVIYIMRLAPLTTGAVVLGEAILGLDLARAAHLLLALIICGLALAFLRLRPVEPGAGAPRLSAVRARAPVGGVVTCGSRYTAAAAAAGPRNSRRPRR